MKQSHRTTNVAGVTVPELSRFAIGAVWSLTASIVANATSLAVTAEWLDRYQNIGPVFVTNVSIWRIKMQEAPKQTTILRFDFLDPHPIYIQVNQALTREQMDEIEDAISSYIDDVVEWDTNFTMVEDIMDSFDYSWETVRADRTYFI
jgi:hypothetical protein